MIPRLQNTLWRCSVILWVAALNGACAGLKPVDLPPEYTSPPTQAAFWDAIYPAAAEDWHVLLNNGPRALDWRLRAIDSATESIDFQTFLWHFDTAGSMVLHHVLDAADRGVTVRILVDDTFLVHEDALLQAIAEHPNVEYRVYNPFKRRSGGFATRQLLNLGEFGRLDHRMHNKAMVIDDRLAIVGGRNIADEYFGLDDESNFRDLELLLGGPVVQEVGRTFDNYWNDRWSFPIGMISHAKASADQLADAERITASSVHLHAELSQDALIAQWRDLIASADTGDAFLYADLPPEGNPDSPEEAPVQVANELVGLFDNAQSEILIVSAYLIPTDHLQQAIKRALDRGVTVGILTNSIGSNNHLTAHSAYRNHINSLLSQGADLHEVRTDARDRDRYMLTPVDSKELALHAKALVIDDDKVFIGSANLDPRSLRINTEMGFLVISQAFNQRVRTALEGDFSTANAWRLEMQGNGSVHWVADDKILESQPAVSGMQRFEDWFFSNLPIEGEL